MKYNKRWLNSSNLKMVYVVVCLFVLGVLVRLAANVGYFQISTVDMKNTRPEIPLKYVNQNALFEKIKPYLTGSYFYVDLDKAKEIALQTEWVSDVKIERELPATVRLIIKEHEPVAHWIREGQSAGLVDGEGKVFQAAYQGGKLPEFDGEVNVLPTMAQQYKTFADELQPLRLSILRLQYTPRASWTMMLNNGVELRLGKQDVNTRMARFVDAWQHSLSEISGLDYVDMRYSDGFATRGGTRITNLSANNAPEEDNKNSNSQINRDE